MHEQMRKNEDKYAAVEDPEGTSREIGITAIKIQDMQAKRCVLELSCFTNVSGVYLLGLAELIIIHLIGIE